ncbi:MAG TPA: DNA topology modulation protein FlaR [Pseudonocardiaceae bacterium]
MRRIAIIGCAGAGKSTLARDLGKRLDLPVTHLDRLFWQPGWQPTERTRWQEIQRELVAGGQWVLDGNYDSTLEIRVAAADTVIFLDFPRWLCLSRVIRRTIASRRRDTQAPGCPDKVDREFLAWIWNYRRDARQRSLAVLAEHGKDVEQHFLTSPRAVRKFLAGL